MESDPEIEIDGQFPNVRLVRHGSVLVACIPGASKMSVEEVNEWIRKSRDREI
jgi:hypothetical protein